MLSENIKQMRKSKGFTQEELAGHLGVVRQTVSKWEKGLSVPDSEMLINIAELFDVSVATLLGEMINKTDDELTIEELSNKLSLINEQLVREKERRRKILKSISIIGLISVIVYVVLFVLLQLNMQSLVTEDTTGTIIGGADGPTAIFVATSGYKYTVLAIIVCLLSVIGIIASHKK